MTAPSEARNRIAKFFAGQHAPFGVYREGRIRPDLRADIDVLLAMLDGLMVKGAALQDARATHSDDPTRENAARVSAASDAFSAALNDADDPR